MQIENHHKMLPFLKMGLSLSKALLPSLIHADLTQLSPLQKLTLGLRHYLSMRILEVENTANAYLEKNR